MVTAGKVGAHAVAEGVPTRDVGAVAEGWDASRLEGSFSPPPQYASGSFDELAVLVATLRKRRAEVVKEICDAVPLPKLKSPSYDETAYLEGRAAAVEATVNYALDALDRREEWGPIPQVLAEQARRAARIGIRPGVLMRRYLEGYRCFIGFIRDELQHSGRTDHEVVLEHLRAKYGSLLDHVIAAVEREHDEEHERLAGSPEYRRARLVRRLLIETLPPDELKELGYDVDMWWHIGVIGLGNQAKEILRRLKLPGGRRLLIVHGDDGTVWAWYGGRGELSCVELKQLFPPCTERARASFVLGYPVLGLDGFRWSHREAREAALQVRQLPLGQLMRSADVLPLIAATQSEDVIRMFEINYILPLNKLHKGGQPARKSLIAYFEHDHSTANAATAIDVSRKTVESHLKDINSVLPAPVNMTALKIALRLETFGHMRGIPRQSDTA